MRLYNHPMSHNARRAHMTALHLGLPVEVVHVDLAKGEQRQPAFLRMNPAGRVPVLEDGGFYLTESHAIMQYLADQVPDQTLYPREPQPRADVNRWLFWSAQHFQPAIGVLNWENFIKPMIGRGPTDPVEVKRGEALVAECAGLLNQRLDGRTWVAQDRLTLADLALAAPLMSIEPARLPLKHLPNLMAWFKRVQELPAWQRTGT
jgi:glutathione S-transferase